MKRIQLLSIFICLAILSINAQTPNFEWIKHIGGTSGYQGNAICTDDAGFVYMAGELQGTADLDPGPDTLLYVAVGRDIIIQKLDVDGAMVWVKAFGSNVGDDEGHAITTDPQGNVLITGVFSGTVDFDLGPDSTKLTSVGQKDIFVLKLDANGDFIWAKSMGNPSNGDIGRSIVTDDMSNVYVVGDFQNTVDFDPGTDSFKLVSKGIFDGFIQKLDNDGNFVWAHSIGGTSFENANGVTIGNSGNVYVTGRYSGTVDFDPSLDSTKLTVEGGQDIFVLKLDPSGNFIWVKSMGGTSSEEGKSITTDVSENILITGLYYSTVDFDPGMDSMKLNSNGSSDVFTVKLDMNGDFVWAKSVGGGNIDEGRDIVTDEQGNAYILGYFMDTIDLDPGADSTIYISSNGLRIFMQKLDMNGDYVWSGIIRGAAFDLGNSIALDESGNIYSTGEFQGIVDFDPSIDSTMDTSIGTQDLFILKLSQCGLFFVDTTVATNLDTLFANSNVGTYQWLDCDNNNAAILGAINQIYIASSIGNYAVIVDNGTCASDTSSCNYYSGIPKQLIDFGVSIYPNPSNDIINIDKFNNEAIQIELFDITGTLLLAKTANKQITSIDVSKYASGIYFIKLHNNRSFITQKIIIE